MHYRNCIRQLLQKYAGYPCAYSEVENELIFDGERDRYQLLHVKWEPKHHIYGSVIYFAQDAECRFNRLFSC
jgi:hypothetical protein